MNLTDLLKKNWRKPSPAERMGFQGMGPNGIMADAANGSGLWVFDPDEGQLEFHGEDGAVDVYSVTIEFKFTENY